MNKNLSNNTTLNELENLRANLLAKLSNLAQTEPVLKTILTLTLEIITNKNRVKTIEADTQALQKKKFENSEYIIKEKEIYVNEEKRITEKKTYIMQTSTDRLKILQTKKTQTENIISELNLVIEGLQQKIKNINLDIKCNRDIIKNYLIDKNKYRTEYKKQLATVNDNILLYKSKLPILQNEINKTPDIKKSAYESNKYVKNHLILEKSNLATAKETNKPQREIDRIEKEITRLTNSRFFNLEKVYAEIDDNVKRLNDEINNISEYINNVEKYKSEIEMPLPDNININASRDLIDCKQQLTEQKQLLSDRTYELMNIITEIDLINEECDETVRTLEEDSKRCVQRWELATQRNEEQMEIDKINNKNMIVSLQNEFTNLIKETQNKIIEQKKLLSANKTNKFNDFVESIVEYENIEKKLNKWK